MARTWTGALMVEKASLRTTGIYEHTYVHVYISVHKMYRTFTYTHNHICIYIDLQRYSKGIQGHCVYDAYVYDIYIDTCT